MFDAEDPEFTPCPDGWNERLTMFQRLCLLRCLRPDKVVPAVTNFISATIGHQFTEPPAFDLDAAFKDAGPITPIVFVLSPGSDPMSNIKLLAEKRNREIRSLSLGQGQGPIASSLVQQALMKGHWAVLQNCHLFPSWMPQLEEMVLLMSVESAHDHFRLWLTSYPSNDFPVTILQNSVKLTNEPPKGLRANLKRSYNTDPISSQKFFESSKHPYHFKKLVFALCFFHAVVQERREFGPLGWNIPYEFTDSDLVISIRQLHGSLEVIDSDENELVPFKMLLYVIGQCNYGGRVTDDKDRRCLMTILSSYLRDEVLGNNFKLSTSNLYQIPNDGSLDEYVAYIRSLPLSTHPEVFGLHANASITRERKETNSLFHSMGILQPTTGSNAGEDSAESGIESMCLRILQQLPEDIDVRAAIKRYPVSYQQSMNTVLCQELGRFKKLLDVIRTSLRDITLAVKGLLVMNSVLLSVYESLNRGRLPGLWAKHSYPSLKSVSGYIDDFAQRVDFFTDWYENGMPLDFWLPGFFFTQGFLTGVLQNYARKYTIPIDSLKFSFSIADRVQNPSEGPEDGVVTYGLFLDGAAWDSSTNVLADPQPKQLTCVAPCIQVTPVSKDTSQSNSADTSQEVTVYSCPLYKTSERRGILSTTGHSTNFVMMVDLPSLQDESFWVLRGCCLLTQLDE